MVVNTNI